MRHILFFGTLSIGVCLAIAAAFFSVAGTSGQAVSVNHPIRSEARASEAEYKNDVVEVVDIAHELTRDKNQTNAPKSGIVSEPGQVPFISFDEPPLAKRPAQSSMPRVDDIVPASYIESDSTEVAPNPRRLMAEDGLDFGSELAPMPRISADR